jgi:tetratricopeptide (TPR) repeat protein
MAQQLQRQFIESDETAPEVCRADVFALQELVDTRLAEGDTKAALNAAERSRNMINGLAVSRPSNAGWQRDLSVSYDKVGEVLQAQGKLPEALNSYRNSLAIADRLAIVAMVESQLGARDDALRALYLVLLR